MNNIVISGFGQFHTNEPDKAKRTPYLAIGFSDIVALVDKPQQVDKSQAQWLIPSSYPSRNFKAQEQHGKYYWLWADLDKNPPTLSVLETAIQGIAIGAYELYNTSSATVENQKARILIPLSEPLNFADWSMAQQVFNEKLESLGILPDRANERAAQLCYLPNKGKFYGSRSQRDGVFFNPLHAWSIEIKVKRDELETQQTELSKAKQLAIEKRAALNLSDAPNIIDAFNQCYTPDEWMLQAGYDQRGNTFRHPNSETGNYSATVRADDKGVLRVNTLSSGDPLFSEGRGAHDAFSCFTVLVHGKSATAALKDAGDNLLTIGGVSFNKVSQRAHRQKQKEQQQQQKPGKAPPPPREPVFTGDIDISDVPEFPIGEQSPSTTEKPQFKIVSISDVFTNPPEPQGYVWSGRIPFGAVTLLAAHGGTGKSLFSLQLAVSIAVGREFLALPTANLKTIFFSAEDSVDTLRRRVAAICQAEGIDPAKVADNLTLIDATDAAVLFEEVNPKGVRFVAVSENYPTLQKLINDKQIKFAIVDNASDVYAADPINRQYVTQFIRALVRLLPSEATDKAVLLLAHVNRVTAKAGRNQKDTEGYADSAAWHNATRSRLFLNAIDDAGGLELKHLKNNFGVTQPQLDIQFRDDGSGFYVPNALNDDTRAANKAATDQKHKLAILGIIREYYGRGEWIGSEPTSRNNAHAMLKHETTYPFTKDDRDERENCVSLLRECQREKLLVVETYRKSGRDNNRWALTEKADDLLKWSSIVHDELDA